MNHSRFFGTPLKGKSKFNFTKKGEDIISNRFFANQNLSCIKNPKQLIHLYGIEFEYILHGFSVENKSPLRQSKKVNITSPTTSKKNVETLKLHPDNLQLHLNQQFLAPELSPLIKIRRCSMDKYIQKQPTQDSSAVNQIVDNQRRRAFSFADDRCHSPDKKKSRRLNSIIFRNLHNNSENQSNCQYI